MEKMKKKPVIFAWLMIVALSVGAAWTQKRLTHTYGYSTQAAVAADGANIYVVYQNDSLGNDDIYFKRSTDSGATWDSAKRLTDNTGSSSTPRIAVNGANVCVVWRDETPGNAEIYFRRSIDYGSTWQAAKRLTSNAGASNRPDIAVSGASVYVVWYDANPENYEIYFRRSTDNGVTWQTAKRLTHNDGASYYPSIAVSGENVYVAWYDLTPGNGEIYLRKSADGGASWETAQRLTNNIGSSFTPSIAVGGENVYVAWYDITPGNGEIYFRKSTDSGTSWQAAQRLTNTAGDSYQVRMAISGGKIFLAWQDDTGGNDEIYYRKSPDGGATWKAAKRLTYNSTGDTNPDIAVNDANVYVVWEEYVAAEWDNEIFIKYSPR